MASKVGAPEVLKRHALADQVYDRIMADLVDERIPPDSPVSIDGLSRTLGVSQTPVREALTRLERTGLVTRMPFRGFRTAPPFNLEDLRQLSYARRVIEPTNAWLAAEATSEELCSGLDRDILDLTDAPRGTTFSEFREYWEADERFHRRIAEHTQNKYLTRAHSALGGQLQRYRLFGGRGVTDFEETLVEHSAILEAIRSGDSDAARDAMDIHIANVWERSLAESKARPLA